MSKPENPSAFPLPDHYSHDGIGLSQGSRGMTLRDWFAGMALEAAWQGFHEGYYGGDNSDIAACAYQIADAMLAERAKK